MTGILSVMAVASPGSRIPRKKGGTLPSTFFFLEDTTGRFVARKERSELVMTCSVMALIFAGTYLAAENGWKAFSLT